MTFTFRIPQVLVEQGIENEIVVVAADETHAMCVLEAYLCDRLGNDWITKLEPERLIEESLEIARRNATAFVENVNRVQSARNN